MSSSSLYLVSESNGSILEPEIFSSLPEAPLSDHQQAHRGGRWESMVMAYEDILVTLKFREAEVSVCGGSEC